MKRRILSIALLAGCLIASASAANQEPAARSGESVSLSQPNGKPECKSECKGEGRPEGRPAPRRGANPQDALLKGINLSDSQKDKVNEAIGKSHERTDKAVNKERKGHDKDMEKAKKQRDKEVKKFNKEMKKILTTEQYKQYQKNCEEMKQNCGNRPGEGFGEPLSGRMGEPGEGPKGPCCKEGKRGERPQGPECKDGKPGDAPKGSCCKEGKRGERPQGPECKDGERGEGPKGPCCKEGKPGDAPKCPECKEGKSCDKHPVKEAQPEK